MGLETTVARIKLEHPVMNAAGPRCKTVEEAEELAKSLSAAVMVGSITMEPREGNQGDVYWSDPAGFSLNSLGLPNGGEPYYFQHLPTMARLAHGADKPLFVSVAGFSPEEYGRLTVLAVDRGADLVELNLGCPNVWEDSKQKRIASFDPALVTEILHHVEDALQQAPARLSQQTGIPAANISIYRPVAVKVSPFSDPVLLEEVASVIASSPIVSAITAINTFPNAFAFKQDGGSVISPQFSRGLAGMAGPSLKAIGLGQVMQWRELLPPHIDVIGVEGINSGRDAHDYLRAGAKAVQIGTAHADQGPGVFDRILTELIPLLEAEPVRS